jgi:hypothetical protein
VQSLPNYCRLKRQGAVLLAAVRNVVIAAKHETILQPRELQARLLGGSMEEQYFLGHI